MKSELFVRRTRIEAPAEEVYRWHVRPGALERLTPPWERLEVLERTPGGVRDGARVVLWVPLGPAGVRWVAEHRDCREGSGFADVQLSGPFRRWVHEHRFEPAGPGACDLEDRIEYELPLGVLGRLAAGGAVRRRLERLCAWRHAVARDDIARHRAAAAARPLRIAVSGAGGLVGSALVPFLTTGGHEVVRIVRRRPGADERAVFWKPTAGYLEPAGLEGLDAVVHLAGENVAGQRWTDDFKERIRQSRVWSTRLLCETLAGLARPPAVLVCASAAGIYGDRGDEPLDEGSAPGSGFLAGVCREWEEAAEAAARAGVRVVHLRFGMVLTPRGGALARLLPAFRLGAGGPVGSGRQHVSWIGVEDAVGAIHHAIAEEAVRGPVNAVSPHPATNRGLARALGRVLRRPALLPLPAFAARALLGEMADALLLASQRVRPARLLETVYHFRDPELEGALRRLLGRPGEV